MHMLYEFFLYIVKSIIVPGFVFSVITYISKNISIEAIKNKIKSIYDKELEKFKDELKRQSDKEIETMKSNLSVEANRINIRFSKLHEKRIDIVSDVYGNLSDLYDALSLYTSALELVGMPSRDQRLDSLQNSYKSFKKVYTNSKIFLPKNISSKIDDINMKMLLSGNFFTNSVHAAPNGADTFDAHLKVSQAVSGPMKESLKELESEMRLLIDDVVSG